MYIQVDLYLDFSLGLDVSWACLNTCCEMFFLWCRCHFPHQAQKYSLRTLSHTLTVAELETSEEKAELSGYRKFILCCCWDQHWTAFSLVYNLKRKWNKGGDNPGARSLFWGWSVAAQMKMVCGAKKSKLKTLFACWYITYRTCQSNLIRLPIARFGLMWQRLCSSRCNQETSGVTDQSGSPAMRTLQETSVHFRDASCWLQHLGEFQSAPEPRLWQL